MKNKVSSEEKFISRHKKACWMWVCLCIGLSCIGLAFLNQIYLVPRANPHAQDNYATLERMMDSEVKRGAASRRIADQLIEADRLYFEQRKEYFKEYTVTCSFFGAVFLSLAFHYRILRKVLQRFPDSSSNTVGAT